MFPAGSQASRLLLTPLLLLLAQGCAPAPPAELPQALIGVWRTSDTRYADRHFELREDGTVVFGQGGDDFTVGRVRSIEAWEREPFVFVYDITYLDERNDESAFDFVHEQETGVLRFQNQEKIVWRKDPVLHTVDEMQEEKAVPEEQAAIDTGPVMFTDEDIRRLLGWD